MDVFEKEEPLPLTTGRRRSVHLVILILCLALPLILHPSDVKCDTQYHIDKSNSSIAFDVSHMAINKVRGYFGEFNGSLRYDDDASDIKSLAGTIKVESISTNNEGRDKHLKSEEFFDAARYPEINYSCDSITDSVGQMIAVGELTMCGVTRTVRIPIHVMGPITDPWGNNRIGIEADFSILRKDFGITWNQLLDNGGLVVGETVDITVNMELVGK